MWMQTECCGGYKVRGLKEEQGSGWRITTWPEGRDTPEKNYWVNAGEFYKAQPGKAPSHTEWQKASFGPVDNDINDGEKSAVLQAIRKWDGQISPQESRRTGVKQ